MAEDSTVYDMIMNIRADEACHRDLNHHFADIPSHKEVDFHSIHVKDGAAELSKDDDKSNKG